MKMTKKTMVVAALVAGVVFGASAKTWTNFAGVGVTCPVNGTVQVNNFDGKDFDLNINKSFGVNEMYMGVHENGFAVRASADTTFCSMNNQAKDFDFINMNTSVGLGAGYAPVRSEKLTLGVFGMLGLDAVTGSSLEKKEGDKTVSYEEVYLAPTAGCNVTAVFTPKNTFSVWGSCSANCMLPGVYAQDKVVKGSDDNKNFKYGQTKLSWKVLPSVGVCWKF